MVHCDVVHGGCVVQGARYHDAVQDLEHVGTVRSAGKDGVILGAGHDGTVKVQKIPRMYEVLDLKVWDRVLSPRIPVNSTCQLHPLIPFANEVQNLSCIRY